MAPKTLIAYFAGFFDGEGYVTISKRRKLKNRSDYTLTVTVTQTNPTPINLLKLYYGGFINKLKLDNRKTAYTWQISSRRANGFLKDILPYLIVKKEEVELGLKFQETTVGQAGIRLTDIQIEARDKMYAQMRELKKRDFV